MGTQRPRSMSCPGTPIFYMGTHPGTCDGDEVCKNTSTATQQGSQHVHPYLITKMRKIFSPKSKYNIKFM